MNENEKEWFSGFWRMSPTGRNKSLHLMPLEEYEREIPMKIYKGLLVPQNEIKFEFYTKNPNLSDFVSSGLVALKVMSTKMKDVLEENQFSGWSTYPVQVQDKQGNLVDGYHGFSVKGKCGPIQKEKAEVKKINSSGAWCYGGFSWNVL